MLVHNVLQTINGKSSIFGIVLVIIEMKTLHKSVNAKQEDDTADQHPTGYPRKNEQNKQYEDCSFRIDPRNQIAHFLYSINGRTDHPMNELDNFSSFFHFLKERVLLLLKSKCIAMDFKIEVRANFLCNFLHSPIHHSVVFCHILELVWPFQIFDLAGAQNQRHFEIFVHFAEHIAIEYFRHHNMDMFLLVQDRQQNENQKLLEDVTDIHKNSIEG